MSTIWTIESRAGVVFGDYPGETPKQAFIAMLADSGDEYGSQTAGTEDDWLIRPQHGELSEAGERAVA